MEGTVTISVEDYNEFKRYEEFYLSEKTVIYTNDCVGRVYFGKADISDVIIELKREIDEEKDYSHAIKQKLTKLDEDYKVLKEQFRQEKIKVLVEQRKSIFQKLFGS